MTGYMQFRKKGLAALFWCVHETDIGWMVDTGWGGRGWMGLRHDREYYGYGCIFWVPPMLPNMVIPRHAFNAYLQENRVLRADKDRK